MFTMEQCVEFTKSGGQNEHQQRIKDGEVFKVFLQCLDEIGYQVCWRIHDISDGGAPQHRERVYLVAVLRCVIHAWTN